MLVSGNNDAIEDAKLLWSKNSFTDHGMTAPFLWMKCIYKNHCNITMGILLAKMMRETFIRA